MHDQYKRIVLKSIDEDEVEIIKILDCIRIKRLYPDLRLLNYYQNLPVSFGADVVSIDRGLVELRVTQTQAIVIAAQRTTFVRSSHLHFDTLAMVERINIEREQAFLSRFSYVKLVAEQRQCIRVNMGGAIDAIFTSKNITEKGKIFDLSVGAVELRLSKFAYLEPNICGTITIIAQDSSMKINSKLLKINTDDHVRKFIFVLDVSEISENFITNLLLHKQQRLIRELWEKIL